MNKPKKKHHYIPVFYLNGFTNLNGYLWVYDKDDKGLFESSPEGIAYENHYFSFMTPEGEKDSETVENFFMDLEGESSKVVRKILAGETLTEDERVTFAVFVSSMMVRVPNLRNNIRSSTADMIKNLTAFIAAHKENFTGMIERYKKETGQKIDIPVEELRQWAADPENYTVEVDQQYATGMALSLMDRFVPIFFNMKWAFLKATGDFNFMTGDNPLHYTDPTHDFRSPYGVGLFSRNIQVTLPLSKGICAFGTWEGAEGYIKVGSQQVKNVNRRTVISSVRFVFADAKSEATDRFVKKYKGSHPVIKVN